jgi:transposase-like protein
VQTVWGSRFGQNGIVASKQRYKCKNCRLNFCEGDHRTNDKVAAKKALRVLLYAMAKGSFRMLGRILDTDHPSLPGKVQKKNKMRQQVRRNDKYITKTTHDKIKRKNDT